MSRHFYKDPLKAAWMAKHFGMRFDNLKEVIEGVDGDTTLLAMPKFVNDCRKTRHFFIHSDSLHLLEPRMGDCGWFHTLGLARIIRVTEEAIFTDVDGDRQKGQTRDSLFRIFMRLIPCEPQETPRGQCERRFTEFMWPESEAV